MFQQLDEDFNLYEIVKSMREQRQSMIQTPVSLLFINAIMVDPGGQ